MATQLYLEDALMNATFGSQLCTMLKLANPGKSYQK